MKKLVLLALLLLVAGGAWRLFFSKPTPAIIADAPRERLVATVEKRDIHYTVEVSGDVTPVLQVEVKPEVGGKLKRLYVKAGDQVRGGDILCEIDDTDLASEKSSALTEIEGAKLTVDKNRRNFERAKDLAAAKLISTEVFDNLSADYLIAENGLVKAERKLQIVEDRLRKTKILSPTDGAVLSLGVTEGQIVVAAASVNSGTSLMVIADLSRLLVDTHVNQIDVAKLVLGQTVALRADSVADLGLQAAISFIAPIASIKNNVKGFQVQALIENPDPRLRPGMTVNLSIPIASVEAAVSVPISAVFKGDHDRKIVYVREGERTEPREVKVGVTSLDRAEITSGVQPGEEILLVEPRKLDKKSS